MVLRHPRLSLAPTAIHHLVNSIDRFRTENATNVLIFTSPKAGSGGGREQIPRLVELVQQAGCEAAIVHTVEELQNRILKPDSLSIVVAAGGDGTLALAAQSVSPDVPILPMPLGTENLLARHFSHKVRAEDVVRTVRHGASYRLDAGMANGRPFLIMASCGFDAEVVRGMHLTRSGHINRFSYARPTVRAIRKYKFPKIHCRIDGCDGEVPDCCWAMVFNLPRYAASLSIEPAAIGDDGMLDLIAFRQGSILSGLKYFAGVAFRRHLGFSDVLRRRGTTIELTSTVRVPYQLDGDYVGQLPLKIETLAGRVHLLLPPKADLCDR